MEVLMSSIQRTCFEACVRSLSKKDLSTTEVECLDKCSWKYLEAHKILGEAMQHATMTAMQEGKKRK